MPWLGSPTSYASGYSSAQRTSASSQSLTTEPTSPPTYWTGLRTRGSKGSRAGYSESTGINTGYPNERWYHGSGRDPWPGRAFPGAPGGVITGRHGGVNNGPAWGVNHGPAWGVDHGPAAPFGGAIMPDTDTIGGLWVVRMRVRSWSSPTMTARSRPIWRHFSTGPDLPCMWRRTARPRSSWCGGLTPTAACS